MSGYFVHGGTQYSSTGMQSNVESSSGIRFSASSPPPRHSHSGNPNYFGNGSYQSAHSGNMSGPSGTNFQNNSSNFTSNQYSSGPNSTTSSNSFGSGSSNSSSGGYFNSTSATYGSGANSYSGQNTNKSNNFNSSFNFGKGNTGNSNSYSQMSGPASYEKSLIAAANQYYSIRGRGRGLRGANRGRGGKGNYHQNQPQNTGPKPIKATEVKAFLYAWCGQRKLKPEYVVTAEGEPKKIHFCCQLQVPGLDYIANVQASNKRDAQTKAAWDFCDNLIKMGYMKQSELPPKPVEPVPKSTTGETTKQIGSLPPETQETIDENGGWSLNNSRQRLNQYCQRENLTPIYKHIILGPEHARIFTCELVLYINALQKELVASESGTNKRQSTAICALSMVRQLFKANLIEKHGEPMKHVSRGGLMGAKKAVEKAAKSEDDATASATSAAVTAGQKRKADDSPAIEHVDENGNWTVDNSRQRLNQFCQTHNIPCDVIYEEEGLPGNRTYTASLNLKVKPNDLSDEKELTASAKGQSKKVAAQGCALALLSQLYKLTLVEANPNASNIPNKKKQSRQRLEPATAPTRLPPYADYGPAVFPSHVISAYNRGIVRKTPMQDIHLNEKHKMVYPTERELSIVQRSVRTIEQALKDVAEQITEDDTEAEKKIDTDAEQKTEESSPKKKSKLQGVMRVGSLAKGLLLRGDLDVQLVLLCHEAPTAKLLVKVAQLLPKQIKAGEGDSFSVVTAMHDSALIVTNTIAKTETEPSLTCTIKVSLTSPVIRNPYTGPAKDPPGTLNKEKCLQALAELRHSKWFQACANVLPSCVVVIRIMRDMTRRLEQWKSLSDWALELLVEKALATSLVPLTLGSSFLRCMEVIATGVLLPGGPGLLDPCERNNVDATDNMTNQERENITRAAQEAVRLFVYRQPHKVLGIDLIERRVLKKEKKESQASTASESPMES